MRKKEFPYRTKSEFYANVKKTHYREPTNSYDLDKLGRFCDRFKIYE